MRDAHDGKIDRLTEQLEIHRSNWKVTHPGKQFEGKLIVGADADVDSKVLVRVAYSAGLAGYSQLHLIAMRRPPRGLEQACGGLVKTTMDRKSIGAAGAQPIEAPASRLLTHAGLPALTRSKPRRRLVDSLRLTPLIDIMVVLVLFLLLHFQASGNT